MGTEVNPWGIGLSVGGSLLDSYNDFSTASKQDKIMAQLMKRRAAQQAELDQMMMGEIGTMRGETPEAEREQAMGEFVGQLQANRGTVGSTASRAVGALSDREAMATSGALGNVAAYGNREADIVARTVAPMRMRHEQGLRRGRLETDMGQKMHKIDSDDYLGKLRLARAKKNPWMDFLSSAMKGAGQAMAVRDDGSGGGAPGSGSYQSVDLLDELARRR